MKTRGIIGSGIGLALASLASLHTSRVYGAESIRYAVRQSMKGRVYGNTSRYMPHQGEQEIARRLRQRKRLHQKYMLNGGFSRRGNEVGPMA